MHASSLHSTQFLRSLAQVSFAYSCTTGARTPPCTDLSFPSSVLFNSGFNANAGFFYLHAAVGRCAVPRQGHPCFGARWRSFLPRHAAHALSLCAQQAEIKRPMPGEGELFVPKTYAVPTLSDPGLLVTTTVIKGIPNSSQSSLMKVNFSALNSRTLTGTGRDMMSACSLIR